MTDMPSVLRQGLDRLLARYPNAEIEMIDTQPAKPLMTTEYDRLGQARAVESPIAQGEPGPWVCVDLVDAGKFAIWKRTGDVYRLDEHGAVEDDPFLRAEPPGDYEHKQLIYELRQHLKKAVRELRDAEDLTRLNPGLWPGSVAADRIRSIYEQIVEDVTEGSTSRPPLLQRLAIAEDNLRVACNRLDELGALDDVLPKLR